MGLKGGLGSVTGYHVDKLLTDLAAGYKQQQFITDRVALIKSVDKQSDRYIKAGQEQFDIENSRIAPGARANQVSRSLSDDSFFCEGHGLEYSIDRLQYRSADEIIQRRMQGGVQFLMQKLLLEKEAALQTLLSTAGNYAAGNTQAVGGDWDDDATGTPLDDLDTARRLIQQKMGSSEDDMVLVLSPDVRDALRKRADIRDAFKYTRAGLPTDADLAAYLRVREIIVPKAIRNTAKRGATPSKTYLFADEAYLVVVPPAGFSAAEDTDGFLCQFRWDADMPEANNGHLVLTWNEPACGPLGADFVRVMQFYALKVINNAAGFLFQNCM